MKKLSLLYILITTSVFAAHISVDDMQIISNSYFNAYESQMQNRTFFKFDTSFQGGYKFSAKVGFAADTTLLERYYVNNTVGLGGLYLFFDNASVLARDLFDNRIDLSIWTGTYKHLGGGNEFKGYLLYPNEKDYDISGFYRMRGTGITSSFKFWEEKFRIKIHLYNNTNFMLPTDSFEKLNFFSFDNEIGLYLDFLYLEFFYGYTKDSIYPNYLAELEYGRGKAGFTFWVGNKDIEFFTTIGLPDLSKEAIESLIAGSSNIFDALYLIAELKFNLFVTTNTISFLTIPALYNEVETNSKTNLNVQYKLKVQLPESIFNWGTYFNFSYNMKSDASQDWSLMLAPYGAIVLSGVEWFASVGYDFSSIERAEIKQNPLYYAEGAKITIGVRSNF